MKKESASLSAPSDFPCRRYKTVTHEPVPVRLMIRNPSAARRSRLQLAIDEHAVYAFLTLRNSRTSPYIAHYLQKE